MTRGRRELGIASVLAFLLLADLAALLVLRPIVVGEGIPQDEDFEAGTVTATAEAYAAVVGWGLLWVPLCTVAFAVLCVRLTREPSGEWSIASHLWMVAIGLFLVVAVWAGLPWLGFGW